MYKGDLQSQKPQKIDKFPLSWNKFVLFQNKSSGFVIQDGPKCKASKSLLAKSLSHLVNNQDYHVSAAIS